MSHKQKHKLKVFNWIDGRLQSLEFIFESLEEALLHCKKHKGQKKIYDELENLVHSEVDNLINDLIGNNNSEHHNHHDDFESYA